MQFAELNKRMEDLEERIELNEKAVQDGAEETEEVKVGMRKVEDKVENMKERTENTVFEELRERESKRKNIILHGLEEPSRKITLNKDRTEDDIKACLRVIKETGTEMKREEMRFCRRIGERVADGEKPRPVVIGLKSEVEKDNILVGVRNLKGTKYDYISIVADLTKRQRQEETDMEREAGKRNKKRTAEETAKNLYWMVVGRKGEKRLIRGIQRENYGTTDRNRKPIEETVADGTGVETGTGTGGTNKRGRDSGSEEEMEQDKRPRSQSGN